MTNWIVKTRKQPTLSHEYIMEEVTIGECQDESNGVSYEWLFEGGKLYMCICLDDSQIVRWYHG